MKQNQLERNFVAKHMNTYNKASVVPDKRSKHLDDAYEQDMTYELDDGPLTGDQIDAIRHASDATAIPKCRFTRGLFVR